MEKNVEAPPSQHTTTVCVGEKKRGGENVRKGEEKRANMLVGLGGGDCRYGGGTEITRETETERERDQMRGRE